MKFFLALIFLASLFSSWYFWKKKPDKRFRSGSIAVLILSVLLFGAIPTHKTDASSADEAKTSTSVKKDSSKAASKRESEKRAQESAKAKSESEKEASLAKAKSEAQASSEESARVASEKQESERLASESLAKAASESSAKEASEQAASQAQAQSESQAVAQAPAQNNDNSDSTGVAPTNPNPNPPVNNGDLHTATATAGGQVVGNRRTHCYHIAGQADYRMNSDNAVYFNSEAEAQAAGYHKSLR